MSYTTVCRRCGQSATGQASSSWGGQATTAACPKCKQEMAFLKRQEKEHKRQQKEQKKNNYKTYYSEPVYEERSSRNEISSNGSNYREPTVEDTEYIRMKDAETWEHIKRYQSDPEYKKAIEERYAAKRLEQAERLNAEMALVKERMKEEVERKAEMESSLKEIKREMVIRLSIGGAILFVLMIVWGYRMQEYIPAHQEGEGEIPVTPFGLAVAVCMIGYIVYGIIKVKQYIGEKNNDKY